MLRWFLFAAVLALLTVAPALAATAADDGGAGQGTPFSGPTGGEDPPEVPGGPPGGPPDGGEPGDTGAPSIPVLVELERVEDQSAVIASLDPEDADVRVRFEELPLLALTVNETAREALMASALVVGVSEEIPLQVALAESVRSINAYPLHARGYT
ncbi:MAG: hypothetical protein ACREON_20005, partial [Gemmatimonadaceae bacterium]